VVNVENVTQIVKPVTEIPMKIVISVLKENTSNHPKETDTPVKNLVQNSTSKTKKPENVTFAYPHVPNVPVTIQIKIVVWNV